MFLIVDAENEVRNPEGKGRVFATIEDAIVAYRNFYTARDVAKFPQEFPMRVTTMDKETVALLQLPC